MKKIYVDNVLRGQNTFDGKIQPIMEGLRKIFEKSIFKSDKTLRIYNGDYGNPYSCEVFKHRDAIIVAEVRYYDWENPKPYDLFISMDNPDDELIESIVDLIKKYPYCSICKTEYEYFVDHKCCPICGISQNNSGDRFIVEWKDSKCPNCGWALRSAKTIKNKISECEEIKEN